MSTLKVAAINNPSASTGGLAISTGGVVTGGGLDYITSSSFSAAAAVNVNNCFTSTYTNYLVVATYTPGADGDRAITLRLRASAADITTSAYVTITGTTVGATTTSFALGNAYYSTGTGRYGFALTFAQPQATAYTQGYGVAWSGSGAALLPSYIGLMFDGTTTADGFSIITSTSSLTGTVRVYGYRN